MTFGEELLDLTIEYVQAKQLNSGCVTPDADEGTRRAPSVIAADYEQIVTDVLSGDKMVNAAASPNGLVEIASHFGTPRATRKESVLQSIAHHTVAMRANEGIEVLEIGESPQREFPVWETHFSRPFCHAVSSGADAVGDDSYWYEVATHRSPHLVLADGSLNPDDQFRFFCHIFPVAQPGAVFVLESQELDGPSTELGGLLAEIIASGFSKDGPLAKRTDLIGYCARNISAIEQTEAAVIVRKRVFDQQKYTTVALREVSESTWLIDPPGTYKRIEPKIFGSPEIRRRTLHLIKAHEKTHYPAAEVGVLQDVVVVEGGIVVTSDNRIIEESFINARHTSQRGPFFRVGNGNLFVSEKTLSGPDRLDDGRHAVIKQTWDLNYGHWLVDTLPRVANILEKFPDEPLRYILNGAAPPQIRELHAAGLNALGIPADSIDYVDRRPTFVRSAIYATPMTLPPLIKSPRTIEMLEHVSKRVRQQAGGPHPPQKIYLSRNSYPRRNLLNEADILPVLEASGYEVVRPEQLSFSEQVSAFSAATHVVGNMGAAFSNLAFSPAGVKVFVLATEHMMHDYFYDLVCHKSGDYWALQGSSSEPEAGIGADFVIDTDDFARIFAEFDRLT